MTESDSVNAPDAAMANAVAVSGRLPQEPHPPRRAHDIFAAARMKVS